MALVELVRDPPGAAAARRGRRHHPEHAGVEVVGDGDGELHERRAEALHRRRRLLVAELQHADDGEHLPGAQHEEGRHLPRDAHPRPRRRRRHRQTPRLDQRRVRHGHRGQREADADALHVRDAPVPAGDAPRQRHQRGVVDRDQGEDGDDVEGGERGRRHGEAADAAVHGDALLDQGRRHLRGHHEEADQRRPDRERPQQHLELLHLRHGAQPPWARRRRRRAVLVRQDGSLVQKPGHHGNVKSLLEAHAGVSYHQASSAYDFLQLQPAPERPLSEGSLPVSCTCTPSYRR
ncbi:Os10g0370750 [Oryza sativa Japonica Group]|uniref:Os10g0370750 protein n=1 Tax=Oryza sativa subsp. japonica TaxID=39947 RepID=A0A0P0XTH6_ORYSJ|nr:Os10g0370750 [Oryza sativa Japonica Group]